MGSLFFLKIYIQCSMITHGKLLLKIKHVNLGSIVVKHVEY